MKKRAQDNYSSLLYDPGVAAKTLGDLYAAIRRDMSLGPNERARLMGQIKGMVGYANESTPLSALMMRGLGGIIGWLISKYFGMGVVGQMVSTVAGFGLGSVINNQLNKPKDPSGWKLL